MMLYFQPRACAAVAPAAAGAEHPGEACPQDSQITLFPFAAEGPARGGWVSVPAANSAMLGTPGTTTVESEVAPPAVVVLSGTLDVAPADPDELHADIASVAAPSTAAMPSILRLARGLTARSPQS
jgi:hypothetical protein